MSYSNSTADKLYSLLPAYIRTQDLTSGEPLRALLGIAESAADTIEADIDQLARDAFIETCEPWVIPYIGDLVGTTPLFDTSRIQDSATATELFQDLNGPDLTPTLGLGARADVAKTIYYRRRKGTLPMLEELARDVTGWAAHAVAMFELLGWTQWLRNHQRLQALRTPDIRSVERMGRLDGPFDEIMHTVDVRTIRQDEGMTEGLDNIQNVAFFLWRLLALPLAGIAARPVNGATDFRFHFSPLGNSAPLFSRYIATGDAAGLATELTVPQPIRSARFYTDLQDYLSLPLPRPGFTDFYGLWEAVPGFNLAPHPSIMVLVNGTPVPPDKVVCRDLSAWSSVLPGQAGIDVKLGRLVLGAGLSPASNVTVFYNMGFPAELGGGPYRRRAWLVRQSLAQDVLIVNASGAPGAFATIGAALAQWAAGGGKSTLIRIQDNRTYAEALAIDTQPASGIFLAIEAADGFRPHVKLAGPLIIAGNRSDFTLTLGGLLVEGTVDLQGSLRGLRLLHTTLVPGGSIADPDPAVPPPPPPPVLPSLQAAATDATGAPANTELSVELAFSITGALRIPSDAKTLYILDSIVDGTADGSVAIAGLGAGPGTPSGPPLHIERSTVVGDAIVREVDLATEALFDGRLRADRIQIGCVRFSYVPPGSRTPRRYRCQPDLAEAAALDAAQAASPTKLTPAQQTAVRAEVRQRVKPDFTDMRYGQPAYLQLSLSIAPEIATGAEDGSEFGAYCHLKQPQRIGNLMQRLGEYLPFGLDAGLIRLT